MRVAQERGQIGAIGLEFRAPARPGLVEEKAVGRSGGVGEGADERWLGRRVGQLVRDDVAARIRASAQADSGVFGEPFVQFERALLRGCLREQLVPSGSENRGVPNGRFLFRDDRGAEGLGERAPLELQQVTAVARVQVRVCRAARGKSDLVLDSVPHLVREQGRARRALFRQRQHQHCPFLARPIERGVGDVYRQRQLAQKRRAAGVELFLVVRLIRDHVARLRVDQEQRTAERDPPKPAPILLAHFLGFLQESGRFLSWGWQPRSERRAGRGGRRAQRGFALEK